MYIGPRRGIYKLEYPYWHEFIRSLYVHVCLYRLIAFSHKSGQSSAEALYNVHKAFYLFFPLQSKVMKHVPFQCASFMTGGSLCAQMPKRLGILGFFLGGPGYVH